MAKKVKLVVDHSERKHARVSPSKLAYFDGCPGYEARQQDVSEMHPVALEGIACHEALDSGDWSKLSKNHTELVQICQDYVDERAGEFVQPRLHKEEKLYVDGDVYGFCDLVITGEEEDHMHVIDYKFGWLPVTDAEENLQGMAYTAGAFAKWGHVEKATMHFLQPRLGVISTAQFTRSGVEEILVRIRGIVEFVQSYDSDKDEGLLHAAPKNCIYCSRKVACPAFVKYLNKGVRPGLLPNTGDFDDPEYLGQCLDALPALEAFVNEVKSSALELRVEGGVEIPGYDLKVRRGSPRFSDPTKTFSILKEYIDIDEFLDCVNISLPKLQKKIAEMAKRGEKGDAKLVLENTLHDAGVLNFGDDIRSLRRINK